MGLRTDPPIFHHSQYSYDHYCEDFFKPKNVFDNLKVFLDNLKILEQGFGRHAFVLEQLVINKTGTRLIKKLLLSKLSKNICNFS